MKNTKVHKSNSQGYFINENPISRSLFLFAEFVEKYALQSQWLLDISFGEFLAALCVFHFAIYPMMKGIISTNKSVYTCMPALKINYNDHFLWTRKTLKRRVIFFYGNCLIFWFFWFFIWLKVYVVKILLQCDQVLYSKCHDVKIIL